MQFTLTYSGELKANASPNHKHELRKAFHSQLKVLWNQAPLLNCQHWFDDEKRKSANSNARINLNRKTGDFNFVPLISPALHLVCELQIFLLRPEPPGAIILQGGDIDNRLKTLFDALRIPKNKGELPQNPIVDHDENPFFCLLEDDSLITGISVKTDRLLKPSIKPTEVHLDIQVSTKATLMINGNQLTGGFRLS